MQYSDDKNTYSGELHIVRGRFDSLSLYEVTDSELRTLERGSPSSIYLNFAIFLLSTCLSFLISLLSTTIQNDRTYIVFLSTTILTGLIGLFLLLLWWRNRESISEVVEQIKQRIPSSEVVKFSADNSKS